MAKEKHGSFLAALVEKADKQTPSPVKNRMKVLQWDKREKSIVLREETQSGGGQVSWRLVLMSGGRTSRLMCHMGKFMPHSKEPQTKEAAIASLRSLELISRRCTRGINCPTGWWNILLRTNSRAGHGNGNGNKWSFKELGAGTDHKGLHPSDGRLRKRLTLFYGNT